MKREVLIEKTLDRYMMTPSQVVTDHVLGKYKPIIDAMARYNLTPRQAASSIGEPAPPVWITRNRQFTELVNYERLRWREAWDISRRDVIKGLEEAIMIARNTQDAGSMVKAWSEVGKLCGLYAPTRIETNVTNSQNKETTIKDLQRLTDAELHDLISQYESEVQPALEGEVLGRS